ncbi:BON domain-containing protein [Nannocystis radixulma]|uniref:BON domain-containing protein n=1 Tax=Nannocystis radixulma TaxID=2995305 RepID=A0ABT5BCV1_9BACT|nr:BON domain-containing protein [Nannocystis radixulma]MDC0671960.1 BON domain-containing protein [Nannocystis radixulma]
MQSKKHHNRGRRHRREGRGDLGEARGILVRAIDRVRAWFGDTEAACRLDQDDRRSRRDTRLQAREDRRLQGQQRHQQQAQERMQGGGRGRRERMRGPYPLNFIPSAQAWPWQFMGRQMPWPPNPESYYQSALPTGVRGRPLGRRGRHTGRGPKGYVRPDMRIVEDINEALTYSPHIDASDIEIRVDKGEVVVTGSVDDRYIKRLVEDLIEDVSGVRDVQNNLRVEKRELQGAGGMSRGTGRREDLGAIRRDMDITVGQDFEDLDVSTLNAGKEGGIRKDRGGFSGT